MEGLGGFLVMLLGWAVFAFQEAQKRKARAEAEASGARSAEAAPRAAPATRPTPPLPEADRALLERTRTALQACVPDLRDRLLVVAQDSGGPELSAAGVGAVLLRLPGDARRRPWKLAALVEEAWAAALLGSEEDHAAAMAFAAAAAPRASAMDRFAGALATAWAPALLLDAAAALSLGGGHLARVRRLADRAGAGEALVVRLDARRRVESAPPAGIRLALLGSLLERQGVEGAAAWAPPPLPQAELELRGPGVWDRIALAPILVAAADLQRRFAARLAARTELSGTAAVDEAARRLLESAAAGSPHSPPDPRVWLAALGRTASRPDGAALARVLLNETGTAPRRRSAARPDGPRPSTAGSIPPPGRARSLALRQALFLGELLADRKG